MVRGWVTTSALLLLLLVPSSAEAFQQGLDNRFAFIATTAFLTLFPLAIVGGTVLWLRKRVREMEEEEQE